MTTTYHIADIRNIALAGHGASGKTSLADALLFTAGATDRARLGRRRDQHLRRRRRRETPPLHHRLPPAPPRVAGQAGPPDRLARLSRLHRQRPERPGRRRERDRHRLGPRGHRGQHPPDLPGGGPARARPDRRHHQDGRRQRRLPPRPRARSARPSARSASRSTSRSARARRSPAWSTSSTPPTTCPTTARCRRPKPTRCSSSRSSRPTKALMNRYLEGETLPADELREAAYRGDRRGQARAGRLRLGPQGHRPQGAARPDRRLRA